MAVKFLGSSRNACSKVPRPRIEGGVARLANLLEVGEPELDVAIGVRWRLADWACSPSMRWAVVAPGSSPADRHIGRRGQVGEEPSMARTPGTPRRSEEGRRQFHSQAVSSDRHSPCLDARPPRRGPPRGGPLSALRLRSWATPFPLPPRATRRRVRPGRARRPRSGPRRSGPVRRHHRRRRRYRRWRRTRGASSSRSRCRWLELRAIPSIRVRAGLRSATYGNALRKWTSF